MKTMRMVAVIAALGVGLLVTQTRAQESVRLDVDSPAKLRKKDGSVRVRVIYECEPFGQPFERNITLSQDNQAISGMTGLGPVRCDGRSHANVIQVAPFEGRFHEGQAFASAFLSLQDPNTGEIRQGQAVETITVR